MNSRFKWQKFRVLNGERVNFPCFAFLKGKSSGSLTVNGARTSYFPCFAYLKGKSSGSLSINGERVNFPWQGNPLLRVFKRQKFRVLYLSDRQQRPRAFLVVSVKAKYSELLVFIYLVTYFPCPSLKTRKFCIFEKGKSSGSLAT